MAGVLEFLLAYGNGNRFRIASPGKSNALVHSQNLKEVKVNQGKASTDENPNNGK